jgi:hypothetical protein
MKISTKFDPVPCAKGCVHLEQNFHRNGDEIIKILSFKTLSTFIITPISMNYRSIRVYKT